MSNELIKFEIQEKDLELVVNEKTLGSLTTNAKQIKELIESALPNYDIANYSEDNIALAKKDKAMLNAASKALNDKRIQFEKEFMQPFAEFKAVVTETVNLIKECSAKIDTVVKQSEENEKKAKQAEVESAWEKRGFTLVPLTKVFDAKWLNKGATLKAIEIEMDKKIADISDDIVTIEAIGEDVELLKSLYLDSLNLNHTIQYADTLKKNRERAKADAEAKAAAIAATVTPEPSFAISSAPPIEEAPQTFSQVASADTEKLVRAFKVTATRENIIKLGEFMTANGIVFEKIQI